MLDEDGWDVDQTPEFARWWKSLTDDQQESVRGRVEALMVEGHGLSRPLAAPIVTSHHPGMRELRATADGHLRVLYVFDPRGRAVLLWGGDKSGRWNEWYDEFVPLADRLYDQHLAQLRDEGWSNE